MQPFPHSAWKSGLQALPHVFCEYIFWAGIFVSWPFLVFHSPELFVGETIDDAIHAGVEVREHDGIQMHHQRGLVFSVCKL